MGCKRKSKKDLVIEVDLLPLIPEEVSERDDYKGAKLRLKKVPSQLARSWQLRQRRASLENKRRRLEANKAAGIELYEEDDLTDETLEEVKALETEILTTCVVGMVGIDGIGADDQAGALEEIEVIGIEERVASEAQAVQSLTARERFRAARTRRDRDAADPPGAQ